MIACISSKIKLKQLHYILLPRMISKRIYYYSEIPKLIVKDYKKLIHDQIALQQKVSRDLTTEQYFKKEGWIVTKDNQVVQLIKNFNKYQVRLLSKIKTSSNKNKDIKIQMQNKSDQKQQITNHLNQILVLVTKISSGKTMTVNSFLHKGFQISGISFAQSLTQAKLNRLDIFSSNRYTGPSVESYDEDLFTSIHAFLRLKLGLQNQQLLQRLLIYCKKSQRILYVEWLKNLSDFL